VDGDSTGYEQIATTGRLEIILSKKLDVPDELWGRLRTEKDHELRAALICLLTAALAAQGTATMVGESTGGWLGIFGVATKVSRFQMICRTRGM
jgi:hypothetical protein